MIVDTSALLALFNRAEPRHADTASAISSHAAGGGRLVVSPYVIAELDYLVLTRLGPATEQLVLEELAAGAWELAQVSATHLADALEVVRRFSTMPVGVTDALNIVLADAYSTRKIATLDHRHWSVLRLRDGTAPSIVP